MHILKIDSIYAEHKSIFVMGVGTKKKREKSDILLVSATSRMEVGVYSETYCIRVEK